mmetsp:Transcript_18015/g.27905  ORF Transcript_18015/g.27905 Transcript_18015/m.27905 type:complete len:219 (-) Transcript_18015:1663-2319(-)
MIYHLVYWLLQAELGTVLLLMLFSFLPGFIRRPVRGLITGLSIPFMRQILISVGVGLAALLAESIRTASEHSFKKHDFDGTVKDKMHHDLKRLRAERNSYIAFGCLFSFLVICQIWALMKKMIDLEDQMERKEKVYGALKKQIENRDDQSGLVEVAKALKELEATPSSRVPDSKVVDKLKSEIEELKLENQKLKGKVGGADEGLKRRTPHSDAGKKAE